jgi:hypothetical protein
MTLDIRGGLKNTAINQSDYVVLEEMLSNAIDSYLTRLASDTNTPPFIAEISVDLRASDLLGDYFEIEISCHDNGAGFGDDQVKAFVTKDSTYKDYLDIKGIGKCKGAGRIQFFHYFNRLSIDSVYAHGTGRRRRTLSVDSSTREVSENSFVESDASNLEIGTTVVVRDRKINAEKESPSNEGQLPARYSSAAIANHISTSLLLRLIILKDIVGQFSIEIRSGLGGISTQHKITASDLPVPKEEKEIPLLCLHGHPHATPVALTVTRYSLKENDFPNSQHEIALCANSAVVQPITRHFIKNPTSRKTPINGCFELILIECELLENRVNQQRDGFTIPAQCTDTPDLAGNFSFEDIRESLEDYVFSVVTPADFDKGELVRSTEQQFGITQSMLEGANIKVHFGDTEENLARRVLKKFQDDIVADTSSLLQMKQSLLALDPRNPDFRNKVNELAWRYTSSIKKMDMANLSQLVVRRSAMIELLRHAVGKLLDCQQIDGKRNEHERIIHNVFFPTGKDSTETTDHDIWLLSEEYQYFEHIASDKSLSSLTLPDGKKLFDQDIDEELLQMFAKNNTDHKAKRPDIALFNQEGAAVIIEFKAPDIDLQEHVNDLAQYARLLASKSKGKIRKFYGYLIGGKIDETRVAPEWTPFSNNKGYFYTGTLTDRASRIPYGELYSEMLFYQDFIDRADLRLSVYRDRLKVSL